MKLTLANSQISTLADAIIALDGRHETQIIDGKPVPILRTYLLTANARWNLARNLGRLQTVIADFDRAKSALINQYSEGKGAISASHPNFNAFAEDFKSLGEKQVDIELDGLKKDDLRLDDNEAAKSGIPIAVLNALSPLIS